jgi:hypothetical protein
MTVDSPSSTTRDSARPARPTIKLIHYQKPNQHTSGADAPPWLDLPQADPAMPTWRCEAFLRHAQGRNCYESACLHTVRCTITRRVTRNCIRTPAVVLKCHTVEPATSWPPLLIVKPDASQERCHSPWTFRATACVQRSQLIRTAKAQSVSLNSANADCMLILQCMSGARRPQGSLGTLNEVQRPPTTFLTVDVRLAQVRTCCSTRER